jgi:hypothetical protein
MKFTRTKIILLATLAFAGSFSASAQSNSNGVPGNKEYAKFASFITDRNIFDPNRYPHNSRTTSRRTTTTRRSTRSAGTPFVALVGTMSYEKGMFAFFNANDSEMKQIVIAGDEVAGYEVKEITATAVTLVDKNKKEFAMNIGDQMTQDGSGWKLESSSTRSTLAEETTAPAAETENATPAPAETSAPASAPAANLEGNDILKRLMEKRAKENQ